MGGGPCSNGGGSDVNSVSPGAAAAAAVAAVAQGLRQQMCSMVAAAHSHSHSSGPDTNPVASLVNSLALAGHCGGGMSVPSNGAPPMSMSHISSMRSIGSPAGSIQDLRISPAESALDSPISSPLGLTVSSSMEPAINMNIGSAMDVSTIGVSGMTYKPVARSFASPRPENLFQEDIDDLMKASMRVGGQKDGQGQQNTGQQQAGQQVQSPPVSTAHQPPPTIKMEPVGDCRGE
nr:unnamed protein product [Callosobruchus chinensis]